MQHTTINTQKNVISLKKGDKETVVASDNAKWSWPLSIAFMLAVSFVCWFAVLQLFI